LKLLITGATGLVGAEIVNLCLAKNYTVHYLTTNKAKIVSQNNYKGFYWDPLTGEIDVNCLNGINAIINLAGASVSKKWTTKHKIAIRNSRLNSVRLLYQLLSENNHQVTHFCSASALGIYPSSLTKQYNETETETNLSFLGKVVHEWEQEVDKINDLNISVSKLRIGIVLSKKGGALPQMVKPIKLGFGSAIGNGKQFQSWIHIADLAHMFLYISEQSLSSNYNAVASAPVTNLEMTKVIAKQLEKSLWLPNIPNFIMKLILGEMSVLVLESQYLRNNKILEKGFIFEFDSIGEALQDCLN
jgi:uncharacterized protein (TIGR01777 family)